MNQATVSRVFLGLGGNLGHPLDHFKTARYRLAEHPRIAIKASSPLYQTSAVGGPDGQPDYLNAVLEIETDLSPHQLLALCQEIETACGRTRNLRWEARTLDIDLLLFDQRLINAGHLILPHPLMHDRHFVLQPLADLHPDLLHPGLHKTVRQLLLEMPEATGIRKIADHW